MTIARRDGNESPFSAWIRSEPHLDSIVALPAVPGKGEKRNSADRGYFQEDALPDNFLRAAAGRVLGGARSACAL